MVRRTAVIYDYTDLYSPAMAYAACYYACALHGYIDVHYVRENPLSIADCSQINHDGGSGQVGIRCCEEIKPGTAGSTGMNWEELHPGEWGLYSNLYFNYALPGNREGLEGRYMTVHELGHTFGNLIHRTEQPYSAMSAVGSYGWDYLIEPEFAEILSLMPTEAGLPAEAASLITRATVPVMCDLPLVVPIVGGG